MLFLLTSRGVVFLRTPEFELLWPKGRRIMWKKKEEEVLSCQERDRKLPLSYVNVAPMYEYREVPRYFES
jgi:hypothetical protein